MEEKLKKAKEEAIRLENENTKLMWKYATGFWKGIIILGGIAFFYLFVRLGVFIGNLF